MTIKYEEIKQFEGVDFDWCSLKEHLSEKGFGDKEIEEFISRLPYINIDSPHCLTDQIDWELLKMQGGVEI